MKEKNKNDIKNEILDSIYEIFENGFIPDEGTLIIFNVVDGENGYPISKIFPIDIKNITKIEGKYNVLLHITNKNISIIEKILKGINSKEVDSFIKDIEKTIEESELISSYYNEVNKVIRDIISKKIEV